MEKTNQETKELTAAEKFEKKHGKISDPKFDFTKLNGVTKDDYKAAIAKANGKKVYHLHVCIDEDETYDFLAVRPTTPVLRALETARKAGDEEKCADLTIKNCLLTPNEAFLEDGVVYTTVVVQLLSLMKTNENFISKA